MNAKRKMAALAALFAACGAQAHSATIYDSQGFEAPTFSLAPLAGQDGWQSFGAGGTANVVAGAPGNATQVVQLDRLGDNYGVGVTTPVPNLNLPGSPVVNVEWSMSYAPLPQDAPQTYGPYFAVEVNDVQGIQVLVAASTGLDAATGEILYQIPVTGQIDVVPGSYIPPNTWVDFLMALDYVTQTYSVYVDNILVIDSLPFIDPGITGLSDVALAGYWGFDGTPEDLEAEGAGYYDNFRISVGVPDAGATGALMVLGVAALTMARRKV
jgi:hypothetical protein